MSAQSISLWNSIPLAPNDSALVEQVSNNLKRPRPTDDDSDDNMSLISRSPSPSQTGLEDITKYDEYVSKPVHEVITVETHIKPTNKGFAMLSKLGWSPGQSLGLTGDGRVDPIPFVIKNDSTGLGKVSQDVRMIETTVSQRRNLDSERMSRETEDQRRAREDIVARKTALESEISATLRPFYCELCDKQFKNVAQYDEHTNSYAHHHKARFRDMQAAQRNMPQEEVDKRKEKERKREEKELRKLAKAAGIKMAKPAPVTGVTSVAAESASAGAGVTDAVEKPSGFKKSGWATVSSERRFGIGNDAPASNSSGGWGSVASAPPPTNPTPPPPDSLPDRPHSQSHQRDTGRSAPSFRTAGWTSLDTTDVPMEVDAPPPPPQTVLEMPPAPPPRSWAPVQPSYTSASSGSRNASFAPVTDVSSHAGPAAGHSSSSHLASKPLPSLQTGTHPVLLQTAQPAAKLEGVGGKSGWQKFQAKGSRRR